MKYVCVFLHCLGLIWSSIGAAQGLSIQNLEISIPTIIDVKPLKEVMASMLIRNTSNNLMKDVKVRLQTQHPGFKLNQADLLIKNLPPGGVYEHLFSINEKNAQLARGVHCGQDTLYITIRESFFSQKLLQISPQIHRAVAQLKLNWLSRIRGLCDAVSPKTQFELALQMQRVPLTKTLTLDSSELQARKTGDQAEALSNQTIDLWILFGIIAFMVIGVIHTRNL
jgi:hypothetical protein